MKHLHAALVAGSAFSILSLAACGGGGTSDATIGGSVSGLSSGATVGLADSTAGTLSVAANGSFALPTALAADTTYDVVVQSQPSGETCAVSNAVGSVDDEGDSVNNVTVACTPIAVVGGTVSGLADGQTLTLSDGITSLPVSAGGNFVFTDSYAPGATYTVVVATQPAGETCTVGNGSGSVDANGDPVNTVTVTCTAASS